MIRLPDISLPEITQHQLTRLQQEIDIIADYAERVRAAERRWKNRTNNAAFRAVRKKLCELCAGVERCGYCEDSKAYQIDHIRPKSLYPEATFVWENYLYACGICNGEKSWRFAVFESATGLFVENVRRSRDAITPPIKGEPVLINPRREDPLAFMELEIIDTFLFQPVAEEGTREHQRADYTIKVFDLNRESLTITRENAYRHYKALLHEFIVKRASGATQSQLQKIVRAIQRTNHPVVWLEMKRQRHLIREIRELFEKAPKALEW